ncbi:hypothetical protein D3C72_1464140 [compost metagenome]
MDQIAKRLEFHQGAVAGLPFFQERGHQFGILEVTGQPEQLLDLCKLIAALLEQQRCLNFGFAALRFDQLAGLHVAHGNAQPFLELAIGTGIACGGVMAQCVDGVLLALAPLAFPGAEGAQCAEHLQTDDGKRGLHNGQRNERPDAAQGALPARIYSPARNRT